MGAGAEASEATSTASEKSATGVTEENAAADDSTTSTLGEMAVETETEVKLECPRRWTMPRLDGIGRVATVRGPQRMTQTATYLDTLGLDLLRNKHTLRRRTGGSDAGWHLKTPGDDSAEESGRVEHRLALGRSAALIPSELIEIVAPLIDGAVLLPVATLRTRRTRRELCDEAGTVLVLVEDDVVEATTYVDGERVHRWREVEVEVVDGAGEDLAAVVDALVAKGLMLSDSPSKLSRALAEPMAASSGKKGRTAGEVVLDYLSQQAGVLQASEQRLREDAPDSVHKARVATRRLRSTLKTYRPLFERVDTDPVRDEVKWLTGALGEPRDAEVMQERIGGLLDTLEPDLVVGRADVHIRAALEAEHERAHAHMVKALDSTRYERIMGDLVELLLHPPFSVMAHEPASDVLPDLVAAASDKVGKQAKRAAAMPEGAERDEAVHEIRKLAKAARYAAEAAGKASGGSAKQIASAYAELQEALGDHQDSVVSRDVVMRLAGDARRAGQETFTYGVLAEREYAGARAVEERYVPLLESARKAAKKIG
ncbi:CYTH and CHAD domain-containing protein [Mobilicoccus massiliensis]|uniref:CYTH and CHAD domain-containing protein n=1 Tax=Mobilicoccus massiliensis TaxID=1522310 RepID=UPI000694E4E5|nr:CYTH and CHAD domain-containing protein [Mobilicoccus massiliensis]